MDNHMSGDAGLINWITISVFITVALLALTGSTVVNAQPSGCWYYWPNVTINPGQGLIIHVTSGSHELYVFTPTQYRRWVSEGNAYAVYSTSVTAGVELIRIPPGVYYVVLYPIECGGGVRAVINVVNLAPTGLSSMMPMNTSAVLGYFSISSIRAWNGSYTAVKVLRVPMSGASLQLNAVVVVILGNGGVQDYWVQDALMFITDKGLLNVASNVWNITTANANVSTSLIRGLGWVNAYGYLNGVTRYYYSYVSEPLTYNLPLSGYLEINVTVVNGSLTIMFGYAMVRNGTMYEPPVIHWFDNVTINVNASWASIMTTPYELTSNGGAYDVELVFGGYSNGEQTMFESLYAQLAILYWNGSGWAPYQGIYNFGIDTSESAGDLVVSIAGNGNAQVTVGIPYYGLLNETFKPTIPMTFINVVYPNGTTLGYYALSSVTITLPRILINHGVMYVLRNIMLRQGGEVKVINGDSVTISPVQGVFSISTVMGNYSTYYLITVESMYPVNVTLPSGTFNVTELVSWVPANSSIIIKVRRVYTLSNLTRFITPNGTFMNITVNSPLVIKIKWIRQYLVNITSIEPISINGSLSRGYVGWVNSGAILMIEVPKFIYLGNGTRLIELNESLINLLVSGPIKASIKWIRQYLVNVSSIAPVIINGSSGVRYINWVNAGEVLNITVPGYYYINADVRLKSLNSSMVLVVNKPLNVTITWVRQYLVSVSSPVPISVNGTGTNHYVKWINESSTLIILIPSYHYFNNGTRLMSLNSSIEHLTVLKPLNLTVLWVRQYLVNVSSVAPFMVNGTVVTGLVNWFNMDVILNVSAVIHYFSNGTRLVPMNQSMVIRVNKPLNLTITWTRQYLVHVVSSIIINVNGSLTRDYVNWVNAGDVLLISIKRLRVNPNMTITRLMKVTVNGAPYHVNNSLIILPINSPLNVVVKWGVDYSIYYASASVLVAITLVLMTLRRLRRHVKLVR